MQSEHARRAAGRMIDIAIIWPAARSKVLVSSVREAVDQPDRRNYQQEAQTEPGSALIAVEPGSPSCWAAAPLNAMIRPRTLATKSLRISSFPLN
ncbi:hypothetical protein BJY16_002616 [Actinoplanes octamycinicus]|uniref:Uncharacterized protein n=1 Tax=Actinoplanes octamycinicus TaxID=135948 RepID=A0A7W7M6S9_9ACTN|nr:hypothetical protein [Actinoplanes octamycinicus]MBB4739157.1 hypothetical protein [Actinoplanes octamycinicus]